jgi:uncharacterized membrane protein YgcG
MQLRPFIAAVGAVAATSLPSIAQAHFVLVQPASWQEQGIYGDPQKVGPCGDPGTPTNVVTRYHVGDMVHFAFNETIAHGGFYRIALGLRGQMDLPADPLVTVDNNGNSVSAPIQNPPRFPVLADGLNQHLAAAVQPMWTADVRLPNMTCNQCFLQITQFMTDHGSNTGGNDGYFYHHCAAIQILAAGAPLDGGGVPPADASAPDTATSPDSNPGTGGPDAPSGAGGRGGTGGSSAGGAGGGGAGSGGSGGTGGAAGSGGSGAGGGGAGGAAGGAGGTSGTGGAPVTGGTGGSAPSPKPGGGGCSVGGRSSSGLLIVLLLALVRRSRRRIHQGAS